MAVAIKKKGLVVSGAIVVVLAVIAAIVILSLPKPASSPKEPEAGPPYPIFDIDCELLMPAELRSKLWGEPGELTPLQANVLLINDSARTQYGNIQSGANTCNWNGPADFDLVKNGIDGFQNINVEIFPGQADYFISKIDQGEIEDFANGVDCYMETVCDYMGTVGDSVLVLVADGIAESASANAKGVLDAQIANITNIVSTAKKRDPWQPPADSFKLTDCSQLLTEENTKESGFGDLVATLDAGDSVPVSVRGGGLFDRCTFEAEGEDNPGSDPIRIFALTGGAWLYADMQKFQRDSDEQREDIDLEGLPKGSANIACESESDCAVEFIVSNSYIRIDLQRLEASEQNSLKDLALSIAQVVVNNITAAAQSA